MNQLEAYLHHCQYYKRLSKHTLRAYNTDLQQFFNSDFSDVIDYLNDLILNTKKD